MVVGVVAFQPSRRTLGDRKVKSPKGRPSHTMDVKPHFWPWKPVLALVVGLTPAGCSSSGSRSAGLDDDERQIEPAPVTCDENTSNIAVSGLTDVPIGIAESMPQAAMQYQNGGFSAVSLIMADATNALTVTLISNSGTPFAQGDKLAVGTDPGLHVSGHSMTLNYFCYSTSGEADVDALSADTNASPPILKVAHLSFDIMCDAKSALPAGTKHVSGCLNYPGM